MQEDDDKIIQEYILNLPEAVKDTVLNSDWQKSIRTISQKFNLNVGQGYELERVVLYIMIALEEPSSLFETLKKEVTQDEDLAYQIAFEVNEKIFKKIKNELIKLTTSNPESEIAEKQNKEKEIVVSPKQIDNVDIDLNPGAEKNYAEKNNGYVVDPYREPID